MENADSFHPPSVPRYALAGGDKLWIYPVCIFSPPVFSTGRLPCSHAGCVLWGLSANTITSSKAPLLFKACFCGPPPRSEISLVSLKYAATSLRFAQPSVDFHPSNHNYFLKQVQHSSSMITNISDVEGLDQWSSKKSKPKWGKESAVLLKYMLPLVQSPLLIFQCQIRK